MYAVSTEEASQHFRDLCTYSRGHLVLLHSTVWCRGVMASWEGCGIWMDWGSHKKPY